LLKEKKSWNVQNQEQVEYQGDHTQLGKTTDDTDMAIDGGSSDGSGRRVTIKVKAKVMVEHTSCSANPITEELTTFSRNHTVLSAATHAFIHEWNEPYLSLPSHSRASTGLVLICRPWGMEG